jgi:hypothetical protein
MVAKAILAFRREGSWLLKWVPPLLGAMQKREDTPERSASHVLAIVSGAPMCHYHDDPSSYDPRLRAG